MNVPQSENMAAAAGEGRARLSSRFGTRVSRSLPQLWP